MSPTPKQPQDIESELIQKMSDMCDRMDNKDKKSFLSQLLDSAPSVFITIVGLAVTFYIYVNVEIAKIQQTSTYQDKHISDIVKLLGDLKEDIKGVDRRLYSLELKANQPK
jgi:RNA processing factor Prp31